ncbi:MAG: A/G-specific adenine glycosylase [bacterium]|nr:A/G-specific adenine glycosylase [bacterium]
MKSLNAKEILDFQKTIYGYYKKHGRTLPWRFVKNPYKIFVSEVMLQQTQVSRALQKYPPFIKKFPNIHALARASFSEVLKAWSGLGYNRRAKFLHEAAKIIVKKYQGIIPQNVEMLGALPGIGEGTAGAILAFAFNKSAVFIETNIRSVFIHYFFDLAKTDLRHSHPAKSGMRMSFQQEKIHDKKILSLIEKTLDRKNPREWYYALVDYGVYIKSLHVNPNQKSAHYAKQSPFQNSNRQIRGEILKLLVTRKSVLKAKIKKHLTGNIKLINNALQELTRERFIKKCGDSICLSA